MKVKKCPYCGRRISYFNIFLEKRKGEHICYRCGKESRIVVNKLIFLFFLVAILISATITALWIGLGYYDNPIGILLVAIPLFIFYMITPRFLKILPLKKYKKSMEAAKAAREYSTEMQFKKNYGNNISVAESNLTPITKEESFEINEDIFSTIKTSRKKPDISENTYNSNPVPQSTVIMNKDENDKFVPIIENNKEAHASSSKDIPLQKIHREKPLYSGRPTFYTDDVVKSEKEVDVKKKADGTKYSANRKF